MPNDLPDWARFEVAPPRRVGGGNFGPGATTVQVTVAAGMHGLAFLSSDTSGRLSLTSIRGHTTGDYYWTPSTGFAGAAQLGGQELLIPLAVDPNSDPVLDVVITAAIGAGFLPADILAVYDVEAMTVNPGYPTPVTIQSIPGTPLYWQAPVAVAVINSALGAAGEGVIVAAAVNQIVHVHGYELFQQDTTAPAGAAEVALVDGAGGAVKTLHVITGRGRIGGGDFKGAPLTAPGNALVIRNRDAAGHTFDGWLAYTQV